MAPDGRAVGTDIDEIKLEMARAEAINNRVMNVEFQLADAAGDSFDREFDAVYVRFLLTHLPEPEETLRAIWKSVRTGGVLIVEDIDFSGSFCYPPNPAYERYCELYTRSALKRGVDPNIGPRLPGMLAAAGCERVDMNVVQPAGIDGEAKVVTPLTMENIVDSVLAEGLSDEAELDRLIDELYAFARQPGSVLSIPRVVQAWGYRPA